MTYKNKLATLALAVAASGMAIAPAWAQNPSYAPGDLILAFQNPGGLFGADQTLYVSLGSAATVFRQGEAGTSGAVNHIDIININSALTTAFGLNWANETTLYAGLSAVWGTASSSLNNTLLAGDPNRTLYTSLGRTAVGTVGVENSTGWTISTDGGMTIGANGMVGQNTTFEVNGTSSVLQANTGLSNIDNQNPFIAAGIQGTAFGAFAGGVQQQGSATSFGTFGTVSNTEFALDLYRILAKTNAPGQVAGPAGRVGSYEGSVVLDNAGNVSFVAAIPEPSSVALIGAVLGGLGFVRRRRA